MGIDRIIDYSGYVQRNIVYNPLEQRLDDRQSEAQNDATRKDAEVEVKQPLQPEIAPRKENAPVSDIRIEMGENDSFGIRAIAIDVRKAISDMEKDSLLHEYQYFVGSRRQGPVLVDDADGMVVRV